MKTFKDEIYLCPKCQRIDITETCKCGASSEHIGWMEYPTIEYDCD